MDAGIETDFPERKLYINSSVRAVNCDCEHVVQPVLNLTQEQVQQYTRVGGDFFINVLHG